MIRNEINMINIELMILRLVNSKSFHWYEGSLLHIIIWYSYIGIVIELMEYMLNQLIELYLSKCGEWKYIYLIISNR